jgi:phosphate transport system substrate-binding protein
VLIIQLISQGKVFAMKSFYVSVFVLCSMLMVSSFCFAAEKQVVAGAGPSTKIVQDFFATFTKQPIAAEVKFEIPDKSAKHIGGIKCSDFHLFGRTGRPLNSKERRLNKDEIFLAKVPIAFAVGNGAGVESISLADLETIYTGQISNWSEIGGADAKIVLVGREPTEALFMELKKEYAFFKGTLFDKKFNKDNNVVNYMKTTKSQYALAFGAKSNFKNLNPVEVKGFSAGVRLGLVYDLKNSDHRLVQAAAAFAKNPEWQAIVKAKGLIPVGI